MAFEIEHKFLVNSTIFRNLAVPVRYRQGYLVTLPDKTIRVRIAGSQGFITVKSRISDLMRKEYEYEIPLPDAEEMLNELCTGMIIEKYRYKIPFEGFIWEVDEFSGENAGLIVAEIEVNAENQFFSKPDWIGEEITSDLRYLNSNLSKMPYNTWDL
jgi:adenylate cyclase